MQFNVNNTKCGSFSHTLDNILDLLLKQSMAIYGRQISGKTTNHFKTKPGKVNVFPLPTFFNPFVKNIPVYHSMTNHFAKTIKHCRLLEVIQAPENWEEILSVISLTLGQNGVIYEKTDSLSQYSLFCVCLQPEGHCISCNKIDKSNLMSLNQQFWFQMP